MRRGGTGTAVVVLVVAAIALAAGFDALRGEGEPEPAAESELPPTPPTTTFEEPAEEEPPLADQLGGTLYYTDENCELQAIEVLGEGAVDPPNWDECRFVLSPNGRRVSGAGTGWDPYSDPLIGRVFQSGGGTIQVSSNGGPEGEPFAGTAPAWRQDGTLTYFADGAVREWPSGEVVLSQHFLRRALETSPDPALGGRFDRVELREALWLSDTRLAGILSAEGDDQVADLLAVYERQRLLEGWLDRPGGLSDLRASPSGRYVAAKESGQRGFGELLLVEPGKGAFQWPLFEGYRAIAWSPDEEWAAVATGTGVAVFHPGAPGPPSFELALDARDLDWRGELGPDAVSQALDTTEASAWLTAADARGRLLVTQPRDEGCQVRALELPELGWADEPAGAESPCRLGTEREVAPKPDGSPTFVSGGELFAGRPGGRPELLVPAADLERIMGRPAALEEVAWVDGERFWAVVRTGESATVALMTADGLVGAPWFGAPSVSGLRLSSGGMAAVSSDRGVVFFDSGGRRVLTFTNGRSVTWAPGEIVAAVSTPREVIFVAPLSGEVVTAPFQVRDLVWLAE